MEGVKRFRQRERASGQSGQTETIEGETNERGRWR